MIVLSNSYFVTTSFKIITAPTLVLYLVFPTFPRNNKICTKSLQLLNPRKCIAFQILKRRQIDSTYHPSSDTKKLTNLQKLKNLILYQTKEEKQEFLTFKMKSEIVNDIR